MLRLLHFRSGSRMTTTLNGLRGLQTSNTFSMPTREHTTKAIPLTSVESCNRDHKHHAGCRHHSTASASEQVISSFTEPVSDTKPLSKRAAKKAVKSAPADAFVKPTRGRVPTPFMIRFVEDEIQAENEKFQDPENPFASEDAFKSVVRIPVMSTLFAPTLHSVPSEATNKSHQLLLKAGFIRQLSSGHYMFLPLGLRVMKKIQAIIEDEMSKAGCQQMDMPIVMNRSLWDSTGRWESSGSELFRFKDRNNVDLCLGPTHEEAFTHIVEQVVESYKQLPLRLYQIGRKFRDEGRPRGGLLRCREFVMKDMYSFHNTPEDAHDTYKEMLDVYSRIFKRLDIPVVQVEADSGNIGGNLSHEYHVIAAAGEDTLLQCEMCGYTANQEKAAFNVPQVFDQAAHNNRLRNGLIPESMKLDPRSVGLWVDEEEQARQNALTKDEKEKQKKIDQGVRSTIASIVKQLMPDMARKDVPMVANLVKLTYFKPKNSTEVDAYAEIPEEHKIFRNHVLVMFRADRQLNDRAICTYFGSNEAEFVPASNAALLLLKYHKYKVAQHADLKAKGVLPSDHTNPFERKPTTHHQLDLLKMVDLEANNDTEGLAEEQRRVERMNARLNIDGGMMIMVDESLVAEGMDLDATGLEDHDPEYLNKENQDRSRGHKPFDNSNPSASLLEALTRNTGDGEDLNIEEFQRRVEESGKSMSELEREIGMEVEPHITSSTKHSPELMRAMGFDENDAIDNELLSNLRSMTTADPIQAEFVIAQQGDQCVQKACQSQGVLGVKKGIEVGHVFYLGTKYSNSMKAQVINEEGVKQDIEMCCFGMGVSRLVSAAIEAVNGHDSQGITWPEPIAPYSVYITAIGKHGEIIKPEPGQLSAYQANLAEVARQKRVIAQRREEKELRLKLKANMSASERLLRQMQNSIDEHEEIVGLWDWGEADNIEHAKSIATMLIGTNPMLEGDIILDDRHHLSPGARLKDATLCGFPWIVVVGKDMQTHGLVELQHRRSNTSQLMTIDQLSNFFNGRTPESERLEYNKTESERRMNFKVDSALMRKYGITSEHKGDPDFLKIDTKNERVYDYNRDVDNEVLDDYVTSDRIIDEAESTLHDDMKAKDELKNTTSNGTGEVDANLTEAEIKALDADYERRERELSPNSVENMMGLNDERVEAQNSDMDGWIRTLSKLRPGLPSPTFDEMHAMYKVGILHEPTPGIIEVNLNVALANMHIVTGGATPSYSLPQGLDAVSKTSGIPQQQVRDLPSGTDASALYSSKLLKEALKQPVNPAYTQGEMHRVNTGRAPQKTKGLGLVGIMKKDHKYRTRADVYKEAVRQDDEQFTQTTGLRRLSAEQSTGMNGAVKYRNLGDGTVYYRNDDPRKSIDEDMYVSTSKEKVMILNHKMPPKPVAAKSLSEVFNTAQVFDHVE